MVVAVGFGTPFTILSNCGINYWVTIKPYGKRVSNMSGIPEIPLCHPFSKGEISCLLSEPMKKALLPLKKGGRGGISRGRVLSTGKAFSDG